LEAVEVEPEAATLPTQQVPPSNEVLTEADPSAEHPSQSWYRQRQGEAHSNQTDSTDLSLDGYSTAPLMAGLFAFNQ